jgi:hypothetical protein
MNIEVSPCSLFIGFVFCSFIFVIGSSILKAVVSYVRKSTRIKTPKTKAVKYGKNILVIGAALTSITLLISQVHHVKKVPCSEDVALQYLKQKSEVVSVLAAVAGCNCGN